MNDCNLVLNPIFSVPTFDKNKEHRVHFSITSPLPEVHFSYIYFYQIRSWCQKRELQVNRHFDCMESIIPRPNAQWETQHDILSLDGKKRIHNLIFSDFCADENTRLSVSYFAPSRDPVQYKHILMDYCAAYTLIEGYNQMKIKPEYRGKPLDYTVITNFYSNICTEVKPSIAACSAEYVFEDTRYTMNCVTKEVLKDTDEVDAEVNKYAVSHWHCAMFASLSYNDKVEDTPNISWKHHNISSNSKNGFFAHSFVNFQTNHVVIAFRGSDDYQDWLYSNRCFLTGCMPAQYANAKKFTNETMEFFGEKFNYTLVGHSLGGGLAQLVSINTGLDAVTFDAPGILKVANKHFLINLVATANEHITAYIHGYDLVNMFANHIVPLIQIIPDFNIDICKKYYEIGATLDQHNMTQIFDMFDENTGYIKSAIQNNTILDIGINTGRNEFQKLCTQKLYEGYDNVVFDTNHVASVVKYYYNTIIYPNNTNIVLQRILLINKDQQHRLDYQKSQMLDSIRAEVPHSIGDDYSWYTQDHSIFELHILRTHIPYSKELFEHIKKIFVDEKDNFIFFDIKSLNIDLNEQKIFITTEHKTSPYIVDMYLDFTSATPISMQVAHNLEFIPNLSQFNVSEIIHFSEHNDTCNYLSI